MITYLSKLINKSDENDDIIKFPHSYYLYKNIYCANPSVYFSIISAKCIDRIVSKTYRQIKYHRDGKNSKHIISKM